MRLITVPYCRTFGASETCVVRNEALNARKCGRLPETDMPACKRREKGREGGLTVNARCGCAGGCGRCSRRAWPHEVTAAKGPRLSRRSPKCLRDSQLVVFALDIKLQDALQHVVPNNYLGLSAPYKEEPKIEQVRCRLH